VELKNMKISNKKMMTYSVILTIASVGQIISVVLF